MSAKPIALIVDDEPDARAYLGAVLEDSGFEVAWADDGLHGFEAAASQKPDLVTLDVSMADQSGVRFYKQLKSDENLKDIPVFIVTGFSDRMRTSLKKLAGFPFPEAFINKPINPAELRKIISEHFGDQPQA